MTSQELISDLSEFDLLNREDDYILENIDTVLPIVQKCIDSSKDDVAVLRAIEIALGMCLHSLTIEEYEQKVFKYACPAAKNLFVKTLQGIENFKPDEINTQSDIGDTYSNLLNICLQIIAYLQRAFQYLTDIERIAVNSIQSLPEATVEIIYYSYVHCKSSEQSYGAYFSKLTNVLTSLFRKTHDLQCRLLHLITEQVEFHCEIEDELESLDKMMIYIYKSSSTIINTDVKTMADLWKAYASLVTKYSEQLKNHHNIADPINCLCDHLIENLNEVVLNENIEKVNVVKTVKISCFILKLIIKFCEQFCGYLGDCQGSLVRVLIFLCRHGQPYLEFCKKPEYVINEVVRQISIALEPLLSQVVVDRGLVREFNRIADKLNTDSDSAFGFLILCCSVLKKLMYTNVETRKLWFNTNYNVVSWVFSTLHHCQFELISNLKFQSGLIPGKQKRFTDLYEYVLVNTTAFILTSNSREFESIEIILLKNVLQTNLWLALLATDVWCVLARFAEADLCHSQLQSLSKMLASFPTESSRPEKEYLISLVQRLFPLMVQKDQDNFIKSFPIHENPHLWGIFGVHNLSSSIAAETTHQLRQLAIENISYFSDNPTCKNFLELEKTLLGLNQVFQTEPKELSNHIALLWTFEKMENLSEVISERYFKATSCATASIAAFSVPSDLITVLTQMKKILTNQSSCTKLYFIQILRKLATVKIPPGNVQQSIIQAISYVFHALLTAENVFTRQKALEIFTSFAQVTSHAEIVGLSLKNNVSLQSDVTLYLKKNLKQQWDSNIFFKKENIEYLHICHQEDIHEPSCKKPRLLSDNYKSDEDFKIIIDRLKADAITIRDDFNCLSSSQLTQVWEVYDIFRTIMRNS